MEPITITEGDEPIVLGQPHCGTYVPDEMLARLKPEARALADTDWHVDRLYDGLLLGASVVRANFNRYVIDANRDPADIPLYTEVNTTSLVPVTDFDGAPIWTTAPTAEEIEQRRRDFHAPYHASLKEQLARAKARHGYAVLFDCHSIRSVVPHLFEGALPDLNVGTNSGESCAPALEQAVARACEAAPCTNVLNGRFKGGWTTRHYGQPADNIHAVQLELSQALYLETEAPPFAYDDVKAEHLRTTLRAVLSGLTEACADLYR